MLNGNNNSSSFTVFVSPSENTTDTSVKRVGCHRILKATTVHLHDLYSSISRAHPQTYVYGGGSSENEEFKLSSARVLSSKVCGLRNCGQDNDEGNLVVCEGEEISPEASTTFRVQPSFKSPITTRAIEDSSQLPLPPSKLRHYERCYRVVRMLGQGSFGQVLECVNTRYGTHAAIKIIKNIAVYNSQGLRELNILDTLQTHFDSANHNIITVKDWFPYKNHLCLVFDKLDRSVLDVLRDSHYQGLRCVDICKVVRQLLRSFALLRVAGVIHCDLKPENVLFVDHPGRNSLVRLIDLGSATYEQYSRRYFYIQSRFYRAPEVLLHVPYDIAIDMWSLGCMVAEMCLGVPLFPGTSQYHQMVRIVSMLGMPPMKMLSSGMRTSEYFRRDTETGTYVLKTPKEYAAEKNIEVHHPKKYFHIGKPLKDIRLSELILDSPVNPKLNLSEQQKLKEKRSRPVLLHFIQGLLQYDPAKRWTPAVALTHPFITGESVDQLEFFELRVSQQQRTSKKSVFRKCTSRSSRTLASASPSHYGMPNASHRVAPTSNGNGVISNGGCGNGNNNNNNGGGGSGGALPPPVPIVAVPGLNFPRRSTDPSDRGRMMIVQQQQQQQQQQPPQPQSQVQPQQLGNLQQHNHHHHHHHHHHQQQQQQQQPRTGGRVHRFNSASNVAHIQAQAQSRIYVSPHPPTMITMPNQQPHFQQTPPRFFMAQQRVSPQMLVQSSSPMVHVIPSRSFVPPIEQRVDVELSRRFSNEPEMMTSVSIEPVRNIHGSSPATESSDSSVVFPFEIDDSYFQHPHQQQRYSDSPLVDFHQQQNALPMHRGSGGWTRQVMHVSPGAQSGWTRAYNSSNTTPIDIRNHGKRDPTTPYVYGSSAPTHLFNFDVEAQHSPSVHQTEPQQPSPQQQKQQQQQQQQQQPWRPVHPHTPPMWVPIAPAALQFVAAPYTPSTPQTGQYYHQQLTPRQQRNNASHIGSRQYASTPTQQHTQVYNQQQYDHMV